MLLLFQHQDHYVVLGLSKLRYQATVSQIRNACKLKFLSCYQIQMCKKIWNFRYKYGANAFQTGHVSAVSTFSTKGNVVDSIIHCLWNIMNFSKHSMFKLFSVLFAQCLW